MSQTPATNNKYREAMAVLQRGRERLVESLADEVISYGDDLTEGGYLFNELLENQGSRLHFLSLLLVHLEQSAEAYEEAQAAAAASSPKPRKPRARRSRSSPAKSAGPRASPKEPHDEP